MVVWVSCLNVIANSYSVSEPIRILFCEGTLLYKENKNVSSFLQMETVGTLKQSPEKTTVF